MVSRKGQKIAAVLSQVRSDLLKAAWYYAFNCRRCGNCCRSGRRICLDGHDVWLLRTHDGGMFIGSDVDGAHIVTDGGVCPYFDGHLCTIHDIRPSSCIRFPFLDGVTRGVFQIRTDCPGSMELYQRINEAHEKNGMPVLSRDERDAMITTIALKYIYDFGTSDQRRITKQVKFDNEKLESEYEMFRNMCQLFILDNFKEMRVIKPDVSVTSKVSQ